MGPIFSCEPLKAENLIWKQKKHISGEEVKEIQNVGGTRPILAGCEMTGALSQGMRVPSRSQE